MEKFNSKKYWETRYKNAGNSGLGAYGEEANFKSNYVNKIIIEKAIKTINDFGCGDSNQISLLKGFDKYTGFDISSTSLEICKKRFVENDKYVFVNDVVNMKLADMTLSLDVTYHLIEEEYFNEYMNNLINLTKKYILIYSVNNDLDSSVPHIKNRKFVDWIKNDYPECKLIETKIYLKKGVVGFYLFEK